MERKFFPDQFACAKKVHCAQARFSPLASDYNMRYADYKAVGMGKPLICCSCRSHQVIGTGRIQMQAMQQIWNWLERTKPANLIF